MGGPCLALSVHDSVTASECNVGLLLWLCEARRETQLLRARSEAGHVRLRGPGNQVVVNQDVLWCHGCELVVPFRVRDGTYPG